MSELYELQSSLPAWEIGERKDALWDAEDRQTVLDSLAARTFHTAVTAYWDTKYPSSYGFCDFNNTRSLRSPSSLKRSW